MPLDNTNKNAASCLALLIFSLVVTLLFFWPSLQWHYVWDDWYIFNDLYHRRSEGNLLTQVFFEPFAVLPEYYRPLPIWLFALEAEANGYKPFSSHLAQLIFFGLNAAFTACLAHIVLQRFLTRQQSLLYSFLISICLISHPAFTVSAVWISSRFDTMSMTFILTFLLLDQWLVRTSFSKIFALTTSAFAAFLCKENAVVLLIIAPLFKAATLLATTNKQNALKQALLSFFVVALALTAYAVLRISVLGDFVVDNSGNQLGITERLIIMLKTYAELFNLTLFPTLHIKPIIPYDETGLYHLPEAVLLGTALLAITACLSALKKQALLPLLIFACGLIAFVPASGIIHIPIKGGYISPRYTILSIAFFIIAIGITIALFIQLFNSRISKAVAAILISVSLGNNAIVAHNYQYQWQDDITLWRWSVQQAPNSHATWFFYIAYLSQTHGAEAALNEIQLPREKFNYYVRLEELYYQLLVNTSQLEKLQQETEQQLNNPILQPRPDNLAIAYEYLLYARLFSCQSPASIDVETPHKLRKAGITPTTKTYQSLAKFLQGNENVAIEKNQQAMFVNLIKHYEATCSSTT